jgi:KDO2-lipid IV(A) lauroyltransferase
VFWYRLHYLGASMLPPWLLRLFMIPFTLFFLVTMGRIRRAIIANLEPVLGPVGRIAGWRRAYRTMRSFAECQSDRYRRAAVPDQAHLAIEGEEHWDAATGGRRGAVLVTAHIGAWDLGAQLGASEGKRRIHVVREEEIDPRAQAFIRDIAGRGGDDFVTHFARDDMRLSLLLREALTHGDIVALQGDRPRSGSRVVDTTLFGQPMALPAGPAVLARAAGVAIVPVFNFRVGLLRTRTVVRPPIRVGNTGNREDDVASAMRQVAVEIEWAIREQPHQWFCFRQLWSS